MADEAAAILADRLETGLVVVPEGGAAPRARTLRCLRGSHPVPSEASRTAGETVLEAAAGAGSGSLVIVLLSGGASSLAVAPSPGLTLSDLQDVTSRLLASGAEIGAVNTVRRHCSRLKGGGILRAASRAAGVWTLALSDVIGDDPAAIGSGPTVSDPTTFAEAAAVLRRWAPAARSAVRDQIEAGVRGLRPETVKPGDALLAQAAFVIVGSNAVAVDAMAGAAADAGYAVVRTERPLTGDAGAEGAAFARMLRDLPAET